MQASVDAIRVIWWRTQSSRLEGSVWHHSLARRPAPLQESARCRASLAADCLLIWSLAGPWSPRFLRVRKPRHSLTGWREADLAPVTASHLRFPIHNPQLDGTLLALTLIAFQASAAAVGASGHALAASIADVKANLKSLGMPNPLAFSQDWSVNALSIPLMSKTPKLV